ncbi:hypothetical protein Ddc_23531 [Ditylenchus destructor]|nr:hypothetical protein Ddc_23531 [Ditylenchus destructor]
MSCSKPLPPFVCDSLYYLNRDQLERFTIVCRPLKNFIERYFHSKPYRIFDNLFIRRGLYLFHYKGVYWHPNRDGYSVQQFLAGQKCSIDESEIGDANFYSFAKMRPYLGSTVRITHLQILVDRDFTYNSEHIVEMESITHLWRDADVYISSVRSNLERLGAKDFQPILNSPTILQCRNLSMGNAYFSFKDYQVLYTVKYLKYDFLEQPGVKPVVSLGRFGFYSFGHEVIVNLLDRLSKAFSSAVVPNAFKMKFTQEMPLTEFRETNKTSGEKLELKKGRPIEYAKKYDCYTLERSTI